VPARFGARSNSGDAPLRLVQSNKDKVDLVSSKLGLADPIEAGVAGECRFHGEAHATPQQLANPL
jgi:hypothetical protein